MQEKIFEQLGIALSKDEYFDFYFKCHQFWPCSTPLNHQNNQNPEEQSQKINQ